VLGQRQSLQEWPTSHRNGRHHLGIADRLQIGTPVDLLRNTHSDKPARIMALIICARCSVMVISSVGAEVSDIAHLPKEYINGTALPIRPTFSAKPFRPTPVHELTIATWQSRKFCRVSSLSAYATKRVLSHSGSPARRKPSAYKATSWLRTIGDRAVAALTQKFGSNAKRRSRIWAASSSRPR
jgi:hypothetical protein